MRDFTVIFYVDGNHGVETYVEHVSVPSKMEAFNAAVAQAIGGGTSSSGYSLDEDEFEHATEIATFDGHLRDAA